MIKKIIFVGVLVTTFAWADLAAKKTMVEYWKDTGITFKQLESWSVNQKKCTENSKKFVACVQALNVLGGSATPPVVLTTEVLPPLMPNGKVVAQFGQLILVEATKDPKVDAEAEKNPVLFVKAQRTKLEQTLNGLATAFEKVDPSKTNFEDILRALIKLVPPQSEPQLAANAINEFMSAVEDPHTYLTPVKKMEDDSKPITEKFFGIGTILRKLGKGIISSPMEGSPAVKAGLKANDMITHVDGVAIEGLTLDEIVSKIRGAENTKVTLTIVRKGQTMNFTIVRGPIESKNFTTQILEEAGIKVGVLKFGSFTENGICRSVAREVLRMEKEGVQAFILDLRANGGGFLHEGLCVGGIFVGNDKPITFVKDLNRPNMKPLLAEQWKLTNLPMVTLIDAGSASASEIVAGALQDYARSWVVGERSFGKATVQAGGTWKLNDQIFLYRTVQRFYQPSGRTNQVVGILPDFETPIKPDATEVERFSMREGDLYTNALPPQGAPWVQPRPAEVAKIQDCIKQKNWALKTYTQRNEELMVADYQLLVAEEILACGQ